MSNLREMYKNDVVPSMMKKFNYKSVMQVPKLEKIVINIGLSIFGIIQKDKGKQFIYDKKILLILFFVSIIFIIKIIK